MTMFMRALLWKSYIIGAYMVDEIAHPFRLVSADRIAGTKWKCYETICLTIRSASFPKEFGIMVSGAH
jgi:hypothetical protein